MDPSRTKPSRGARLSKRSRQGDLREKSADPAPSLRAPELLGSFRVECEATIVAIRSAVRALCEAAGVDPLRPQDVSRRLKLNKNLTWKFARILIESDALDATPMLPGPEGVTIYLRAFESAGVRGDLVAKLRDAIESFDAMVTRHFGGRMEFELVLDGLRTGANLEQSRRLAFRGAAGVFGVQAAARVTAQILAPSRVDPSQADLALMAGLVGVRRLRPIARLPVFRSLINTNSSHPTPRPFIASGAGSEPDFLLRDFSSFPDASVSRTEADGKFTIELDNGPLGRIGESDLFFGSLIERAYVRRGTTSDDFAQFISAVTVPSESFVSDIFVHRSIEGPDSVDAAMFGTLSGPVSHDADAREPARIPIDCTPAIIDDLHGASGAKLIEVASVPNYLPMVERAFAALGESLDDYRLIRVAMTHPPMPASLVVRWKLPI